MASSRTGDLLLHMGDVTPALIREMNQEGPPVLVPPESPLASAGNAQDLGAMLREIANRAQVQAEAAGSADGTNPTPGFVTLDSLHGTAVMAGLPFALVVDGCLQDVNFKDTMRALGFAYDEKNPSDFFYIGESEVVTREAWDMAQAMRNYGRLRPFLTGRNPVTLAAKPGTYAMAQANPFVVGGPALGPLAVRAHTLTQRTLISPEPWDLLTLVRRLAEFNGIGEINLEGSISWSDFEGWRKAMPEGVENLETPVPDAVTFSTTTAVVQRLNPGIRSIEDFSHSAKTGEFILSDQRAGIWCWKKGQQARRVEEELPFSSLGALNNGTLFYHGWTKKLRILGEGNPVIGEGLYLGMLGRGSGGDSLLVFEDDGQVDKSSIVWRTSGGELQQFAELETTGMISAVEWQPGVLFYTTDSSAIHCWENGQTRNFCRGLAQPRWLACDNEYLYCLSMTGRTLYRIDSMGKVIRASLGRCGLDRSHTSRAFQAADGGRILIGSGDEIVEIDMSRLSWE